MAISQEQADTATEFHYPSWEPCGATRSNRFRRSGKTQRWKRQPARFKIPVKHGMYVTGYIDNENAHLFHVAAECPVISERPVS